jgi:hypothetical protein
MPAIKINTFGGMIPSVDPLLLPENAAETCENAWLYSGSLAGMPTPTSLRALTTGTTFAYRIPAGASSDVADIDTSTWVEFSDANTTVLKSQVIGDTYDRYYWTSPSEQPKYTTLARIEDTVRGNDEYTMALLHFDGADAATTITESAYGGTGVRTWTAAANAQIDTAQSKFGGASGLFDGTGDWVTTPDHADFVLGSGDFTVDFWARPAVDGTVLVLAGQCDVAGIANANSAWLIARTAGNAVTFSVATGASATTVTSTSTLIAGAWMHIAAVKTSSVLKLFINGTQEGGNVAHAATVNNSTSVLGVGSGGDYVTNPWNGWIDEFRLSVGIARWTTTFTPETSAYVNDEAWLLGVPTPGTAPTISSIAGGVSATNRTTAYVYTWVTTYGEEGPPSTPVTGTGRVDDSWTLALTAPTARDMGYDRTIETVRIYRTVTSANNIATYYLVAEQDATDTSYVDTALDDTLTDNSVLESELWSEPPTDLDGWVAMPNGIFAGWRANEVWFSEPYRPHAWPATYALAVDYPIVGLGVLGQTLVVATNSYPFAITGVHPAAMTQAKLMSLEPCLSRGSIISAPDGVYYTSPNGLIKVARGVATNITAKLATKDKWQETVGNSALQTLRAGWLGGAYYGFGTTRTGVFDEHAFDPEAFVQEDLTGSLNGVMVDPNDQRVAFTTVDNAVECTHLYNDPWTGELFVIRNDTLYHINIADPEPLQETFLWKSKKFQVGKKNNISAVKIFFDTSSTTPVQNPTRNTSSPQTLAADQYGLLRVYGDDTLVSTHEIRTSGEMLRIPSGAKYDYWQFEIEGRVKIRSLQVASAPRELGTV